MFHKDTIRLIKKTFNRFISLLMIVLIGSAFMMGLLSTRTIMEDNVDRYADELSLQDIQFYSSYGFCDEDIEALKELECIDEVFASRFRDVYSLSSAGNVSVWLAIYSTSLIVTEATPVGMTSSTVQVPESTDVHLA